MSASMIGGWHAGSIKRLWGFITQLSLQEEKSFSDAASIVKNLATCTILPDPYCFPAFSVSFSRVLCAITILQILREKHHHNNHA